MIFPDQELSVDDQFQRGLIYAAERYASKTGRFLFVNFVDPAHQALPELLRERRVDGVLLASYPPPQFVEQIHRHGLPVVAIEDFTQRLCCDCVISNPQPGGVELIRRLIAAGHRRFAFVVTNRTFPMLNRRFQVMEEVLAFAGLRVPESYWLENVKNTMVAGAEAVKQLLALPERPDAIVFANDLIASGGVLELLKSGVAIPQQISVAGFDNLEIGEVLTPPLTSVELHLDAVVRAAIDRLAELIAADNHSDHYTQIEIKSSLIWRQTCRV